MSKSPHNAGQTIEIEHLIHGPVSTVDFGKIAVTENWGRLFIKQGDSNEVVIERGAYVALRDAIDHFIGPQPDPRDAVIARLVDALGVYADMTAWTQPPVKTREGLLTLEYENQASKMQKDRGAKARAALAAAKAVQHG